MRPWPILLLMPLWFGAADPRPELIELQLSGQDMAALQRLDLAAAEDPQQTTAWGFDYLRGHLLERLGRQPEAAEAFLSAAASTPTLARHSTFRLAQNRYQAGHSAEAAELLVALLQDSPDEVLKSRAIRLLLRTFDENRNCDALEASRSWGTSRELGREVEIRRVECDLAAGRLDPARSQALALLRQNREDEPARRAAVVLASLAGQDLSPETAKLIGMTLHHHRDFRGAIPFLDSAAQHPEFPIRASRSGERDETLYSLARSYYWLGEYAEAEKWFTSAAQIAADKPGAARALFQRGRAQALRGEWDRAVDSYQEASRIDPNSSWAAAADLSVLRLEWRQGREERALEILQRLRTRGSARLSLERAALFLAASDLVRGRADRAGDYLRLAQQARQRSGPEIWYWQGRLAELEERHAEALDSYLSLLLDDSFHPFAWYALERLRSAKLTEAARQQGEQLARSDRTADLLRASLLLPATHPDRDAVVNRLRSRWLQRSDLRDLLNLAPARPAEWNIWRQPSRQAEDQLLALGVVETVSTAFRSAFPLADTYRALAGSRLLNVNGLYRRSLQTAEVVAKRIPRELPDSFLPSSYRQLLYPNPYDFDIVHQSSRFGVDPDLLRAIIREESRFDLEAVSEASARGLTQFILPTAQRLARKLGTEDLQAADLHRPDIAILLGAAYLAELQRHFNGDLIQVIAAYNAGEDLARLWKSYCFSQEPEELLTKVGYRQTREYIEKVLASRLQYREIYSSPRDYSESERRITAWGGSDLKLLSK